jgi:hypothetical protein
MAQTWFEIPDSLTCKRRFRQCVGGFLRLDENGAFHPLYNGDANEEPARIFLQGVNRLHGLPRVLVSDGDPRFVSAFWETLRRRLGGS